MSSTRREILERKTALLRDLRTAYNHGVAMPGEMALSQRELSAKYNLSMRTIAIELQKLVEEGVLYTVPRVGTFVGRPQHTRDHLFLAVFRHLDAPNIQVAAIRAGFEERIASLGGTSLVMDYETALRYRTSEEIVTPMGVFECYDYRIKPVWLEPGLAHIEFGELNSVNPGSDAVYFDNCDGGWKATRHLLALGHRKVAFIALHAAQEDPGFLLWSKEREDGWRRALQEAGLSAEGLDFRPEHMPSLEVELLQASALNVAARVLEHSDITAIVAVNHYVAKGLIQTLRNHNWATERWPAIVSFDSEASSLENAINVITELRLPWEDIGREAAQALWERSQGLVQAPQQRCVPMTLIRRLSCRREWHRAPGATSRPQPDATAVV